MGISEVSGRVMVYSVFLKRTNYYLLTSLVIKTAKDTNEL